MDRQSKTVLGLATAQALFQTAAVLIVTIGGLAGQQLAPAPALATLPAAFISLGTVAAVAPFSMLMSRFGRRPGFLLGSLFGIAGAATAVFAVLTGSFAVLCLGIALVGVYQASAQFYRFAAAEAASEAFRGRAISLVLAGGVVAALAGPHLGAATRDLLGAAYAGSFAVVAVLALAATALLSIAPMPAPTPQGADAEPARPLPQIVRQPRFIAAVVAAAVGFGVMVLVMTVTPLSMLHHDHGVADAAMVIQWHVLAMFTPSFFTGWLVKRFGLTAMMLTGAGLLAVQVAVALSGVELGHFLVGLVIVGLGWNFLYVGGSTLLTQTYRPSERGKVQGLNDFIVVSVAAVAAFSAGALEDAFGWRGVNLATLPLLAVAAVAILAGRGVEASKAPG